MQNLVQLLKNLVFYPQDTSVFLEIGQQAVTGAELEPYLFTLYLHELTLVEALVGTLVFRPCIQCFVHLIFDKLTKLLQFLGKQETKKGSSQMAVVKQLVEMGFSESQADMAVREIEYLDVNLAAEWLFNHPEAE